MAENPDSFGVGEFRVVPRPDPDQLADKLNKLREAIDQCRLLPGPGYQVKRGTTGTTLTIKRRGGGGGTLAAEDDPCPFDVTPTVTSAGVNLSVQPGLVNGVLPSNMFSVLTASGTGTKYVCVDVTTNGKNVTGATLAVKTSVPTAPAATADVAPSSVSVIVSVVSGSVAYKTIPCGNITMRVSPSITEDNPTATGGERNYTQFYQWAF